MKLFKKSPSDTQYNTLENKYETLVESMKSEVWKKILAKLDEEEITKRLKKENKSLRKEKKEWKARALLAEEELSKR